MLTNIGIELPSTCWTSRIVAQRSDVKRRENFPFPWHRPPRGTFLSNLYLDETKHDLTLGRCQLRSQPSCLSIPIRFPSSFRCCAGIWNTWNRLESAYVELQASNSVGNDTNSSPYTIRLRFHAIRSVSVRVTIDPPFGISEDRSCVYAACVFSILRHEMFDGYILVRAII